MVKQEELEKIGKSETILEAIEGHKLSMVAVYPSYVIIYWDDGAIASVIKDGKLPKFEAVEYPPEEID